MPKKAEEPHRLQEKVAAPAEATAEIPVTDDEGFLESLGHSYTKGELVLGLVGPVGTDFDRVVAILTDWLTAAKYEVKEIRVSRQVINRLIVRSKKPSGEFERISWGMEDGDKAREKSGDNSILALGAAFRIAAMRNVANNENQPTPRRAYIVNSLKHPEEVLRLREIYPLGFYGVGIHSDKGHRTWVFTKPGPRKMTAEEAERLMERDENEHLPYGQRLIDTFHLADFFVRLIGDDVRVENEFGRLLEILFGDPYKTPTFDEYAMFLAFASSLRSADMSRQVGAVIA